MLLSTPVIAVCQVTVTQLTNTTWSSVVLSSSPSLPPHMLPTFFSPEYTEIVLPESLVQKYIKLVSNSTIILLSCENVGSMWNSHLLGNHLYREALCFSVTTAFSTQLTGRGKEMMTCFRVGLVTGKQAHFCCNTSHQEKQRDVQYYICFSLSNFQAPPP